MNFTEAKNYLQAECNHLPSGDSKTKFQNSLQIISDLTNSPEAISEAMFNINDIYWDETLLSRVTFGQAIYTVSETVDPVAPFPIKR